MKTWFAKAAGAVFLLTGCLCTLPGEAWADAGDGIEGENLRLSLAASAGTRFNSNLFYQDTPTAPGAFALTITPQLSLSTIRKDPVSLEMNWGLTWAQYISDNRGISGQSGLSTDLGASALFNQQGALSLKIEEAFQRTNDPPSGPSTEAIHRVNNRLGGIVGIHPGGRALQGYLSYHWSSFNYNFDEINFSQANSDQHAFQGRFAWQFRPRTAAMLTANYTLVNYDEPQREVASNSALINNNSRPFRISGTLNGLILNNVSAELTGGYGRANYVSGPSYSGFIGRLLVSYFIRSQQDAALSAGATRSFSDTPLGNYVLSNLFTLSYSQPFLDKRLKLNLGARYDRRTYFFPDSGNFPVVGADVALPDEITDNRVGGRLSLSYSPLKWLGLNGAYDLNTNLTNDNVIIVNSSPEFTLAGRDYIQHVVSLSVTARY